MKHKNPPSIPQLPKLKTKFLPFLPYLAIFLFSLFALSPLISHNYYYGHDTIYHVASVIGQAEDLSNSKILGYIAGDFGYGEGLFYPQLSHYTAALILNLIRPFGLDVFAALKITHFLTIILAGIFMYRFMYRVTKNRPAASLSSIFYITLPYFLSDIFIRDALAESFVFIFLPLVFRSLHELIEGNYRTFLIFFVLGFSGLLYSHLVLTMYTVLFLIIISPFIYKHLFTKQKLKYLGLGILLVSLISLPMIVPLLENRLNTDYFVFKPGSMFGTSTVLNQRRLSLLDFFSFNNNIFFCANLIALLLAFFSIFRFFIKPKKRNPISTSLIILFLASLILMTKLFDWTSLPDLLLMLQFPWRLEIFFGFAVSALAGLELLSLSKKLTNFPKIIPLLTSIVSLASCLFYVTIVQQSQTYTPISLNNATNQLCTTGYPRYLKTENAPSPLSLSECTKIYRDYYPVTLTNNISYLATRDHDTKVLSGKTTISNFSRKGTNLSFSAEAVDDAILELPLLYYLGYAVEVTSPDGSTSKLPYSEGENGFITIHLDENYREISVHYSKTFANQLSNLICLTAILSFSLYLYKDNLIRRKHAKPQD